MLAVTKSFSIEAGHRLMNHAGRCANLHGHHYVFEVTTGTVSVVGNRSGMVVDFGELKQTIGAWLDRNWDHAFLVQRDDRTVLEFLEAQDMRHFVLDDPPTAEVLARFLGMTFRRQWDHLDIQRVVCRETPTSEAIWTL